MLQKGACLLLSCWFFAKLGYMLANAKSHLFY